jgi:predicted kinase
MRRYDEAKTLAATIGRREHTPVDVPQVAGTLARFHQSSPVMAGPAYGTRRLERGLDRNIEELLAVTEDQSERRKVRALARFLTAFVDSRGAELNERAASGHVRDCHGDLRAEHVVLETPLSIVDCVEFDAELRTLDVADDVAFLVMDLERLGAPELIGPLIDSYRAAGGSPGDGPLLAFFAVHRALVRAKVLLVRAAQDPPDGISRERPSAEVGALFEVAERFSWRARLPLGIVCCGVPASGKSHLARALAKRARLTHLGSDATRKQLAGLRSTQAGAPEHYSDEFSRATYAEMGRRAALEIAGSGGVILDATFRRRRDRDAFGEGFGGAAPLLFVECLAPAEVLVERARRRERDPGRVSDATVEIVMRERHSWEPLDELSAHDHVALRTDRCVESVIADLAALLDERLLTRGR